MRIRYPCPKIEVSFFTFQNDINHTLHTYQLKKYEMVDFKQSVRLFAIILAVMESSAIFNCPCGQGIEGSKKLIRRVKRTTDDDQGSDGFNSSRRRASRYDKVHKFLMQWNSYLDQVHSILGFRNSEVYVLFYFVPLSSKNNLFRARQEICHESSRWLHCCKIIHPIE